MLQENDIPEKYKKSKKNITWFLPRISLTAVVFSEVDDCSFSVYLNSFSESSIILLCTGNSFNAFDLIKSLNSLNSFSKLSILSSRCFNSSRTLFSNSCSSLFEFAISERIKIYDLMAIIFHINGEENINRKSVFPCT